jgi:hypothetical protein
LLPLLRSFAAMQEIELRAKAPPELTTLLKGDGSSASSTLLATFGTRLYPARCI